MAGESALQNEAFPAAKQRLAAQYRFPGSSDRHAGRLLGVDAPGNCVWIDHARQTLKGDRRGECALT